LNACAIATAVNPWMRSTAIQVGRHFHSRPLSRNPATILAYGDTIVQGAIADKEYQPVQSNDRRVLATFSRVAWRPGRPGGRSHTAKRISHRKMDIDDLANLVALNRGHFSRVFMEYIVVRRVERAKAMISGTGEPLADVALACGFADQAHLNRRFRDIVGISPGRWRRSNTSTKPIPNRSAAVQTTGALRGRAARTTIGLSGDGSTSVQ
jgi:AraC-like DNA-binding protein